MKNRKIFDFGLYHEGFKQLKLIGILFSVIFALEAIMLPISTVISMNSALKEGSITAIIASSVTGSNMHPIMIAAFCVIAPLMTLSLFSFLNKRNTSDFYHSIPHTRICIFSSFFAAIITWLVIIIGGTSLLSLAIHLVFSKYFAVVIISWMMLTLNCFVASVLVSASVVLAMTITGTTASNVTIASLIIFLPRFVATVITTVIMQALPMVSSTHFTGLLENKYNIVTSFVFNVFINGSGSSVNVLTDGMACIYTAALAILYIIAACTLFHFRKSESASQSAPNHVLQVVYRITITMVVCIGALSYIFARYSHGGNIDIYTVVVLYIIATVIYFAYELITTRKWKNLLRAIPGLGIVVILNVAVFGGMVGIYRSQLNYTPSATEITSISIVSDSGQEDINSLTLKQYIDMRNSDIEIKDENIIKIVAESLKENADAYKVSITNYYNKFYGTNYGSTDKETYINVCVKIESNGSTHYRNIFISTPDNEVIANALEGNQAYKDMFIDLPKAEKNTLSINGPVNCDISTDKLNQIYEEMCKEVASADFATWYNTLNANSGSIASLYFNTTVGLNSYSVNIPLYTDIMPNACKMYLEEAYASTSENRSYITDILKSTGNDKSFNFDISLTINDATTGKSYQCYYGNDFSGGGSKSEVISFLSNKIIDTTVTTGNSYAIISIYDYFTQQNYSALFNLGELTTAEIDNANLQSELQYSENNSNVSTNY